MITFTDEHSDDPFGIALSEQIEVLANMLNISMLQHGWKKHDYNKSYLKVYAIRHYYPWLPLNIEVFVHPHCYIMRISDQYETHSDNDSEYIIRMVLRAIGNWAEKAERHKMSMYNN